MPDDEGPRPSSTSDTTSSENGRPNEALPSSSARKLRLSIEKRVY